MRTHGSAGGTGPHPRYSRAVTRRLRWAFWWTCLVTVLLLATLEVPYAVAAWWLRHEEGAWAREDARGARALGERRVLGANEAARRLADLAGPIGVELAGFRPSDAAFDPVIAFVQEERLAGADDDRPLPPAVTELLRRDQATLGRIEALLGGSAAPSWPSDPRGPLEGPLPPVPGLRVVNALLLARAVERDQSGDPDGADRALRASARLCDGVNDRPETVSQMSATLLASARAGVLRRLRHPPAGWVERMNVHDFRRPFLTSYQMSALQQMRFARQRSFVQRDLSPASGEPQPSGLVLAADRQMTTPYWRCCAADYSRRLRALAAALRGAEPCRVDTVAIDAAAERAVPRWSVVAGATLHSSARHYALVRDAELEEELTRVVLETRGLTPNRADAVASTICAGLVWTRSPDDAGGVAIEAAGVEVVPRVKGVAWRYHVRPTVAPGRGDR
jgi:hypothetical protein